MNISRVATPYIYQRAAARVRRMARSWARADAYVHNVMHVRTCSRTQLDTNRTNRTRSSGGKYESARFWGPALFLKPKYTVLKVDGP